VHRQFQTSQNLNDKVTFSCIWGRQNFFVIYIKRMKIRPKIKQLDEACQNQGKFRPATIFPTDLSPETVDSFSLVQPALRWQPDPQNHGPV
jgi:hypothetical protein